MVAEHPLEAEGDAARPAADAAGQVHEQRPARADPDAVLIRMLTRAVADVERLVRPAAPAATRIPEPALG